mmetsp:Transcript_83807/g.240966  ORF Transcript_83807/g.240966 Transcript_83807/m.240966 type:complete len:473 (+) Transcript_83807:71-1489(+)
MQKLFGDKLLSKSGEVSTAEALAGKGAVGIYFSAHWCPPCRGFTPKLAEWYKSDLQGKGLEVVFVSSDRDEGSFGEYYGEMPWLALPFGSNLKKKLDKKFEVEGIPCFVIVDAEGNVLNPDGRAAVSQDPEGKNFPWKAPGMEGFAGAKLLKGSDTVDLKDAFAGKKAVGLYFSAHWCPPCRGFTPKLAEWYTKDLQREGLEIVFVSSDKDEDAFRSYYSEQPWLALDFADRAMKDTLSKVCKVQGIPSFVIINPTDFSIINIDGRQMVSGDPKGNNLPWLPPPPKPVYCLDKDSKLINETPLVLVLCETADDAEKAAIEAALTPVGQKYLDVAKAEDGDPEIIFMMGKTGGGLSGRIRSMMSLEELTLPHEHPLVEAPGGGSGWGCDGCSLGGEGKTRFRCSQGCDFDYCGECNEKALTESGKKILARLVFLDIPSNGAYYIGPEGPITTSAVEAFVADFKAGKLDRKQMS